MPLKTILVHVDATPRAGARIALAAQLALASDAHLIGLAPTGWAELLNIPASFDVAVLPVSIDFGPVRQACRAALSAFEAQARALGVVSVESRQVDDDAGTALAMHGRYSDLVVVGQARGPDAPAGARSDLPEYVVLNCTAPVLVVPAAGTFAQVGRDVAVAWNGSMEAHRAVATALPLLRGARRVYLVMVNPRTAMLEGDEPGADMALYLARHGIRVEVVSRVADDRPDEALLAAAHGCNADLIVMGAYGRSRLRELLMGGATRTMLESMTLPVWMAH